MVGFSLMTSSYMNIKRTELIQNYEQYEDTCGALFEDVNMNVDPDSWRGKLLVNNLTFFYLLRIMYIIIIVFMKKQPLAQVLLLGFLQFLYFVYTIIISKK